MSKSLKAGFDILRSDTEIVGLVTHTAGPETKIARLEFVAS